MSTTQPRTRKPTGTVAFPLLLVEGMEKAGKSYAAYQLSASEKVGRTFVLDLTDGTADEYATLGPYEILEHNGTHTSMVEQVRAACAVESDPDKPNVVIVDSGTEWWNMLVSWADSRARNSTANKRKLAADPDAEVSIPMNIWNDAGGRWAEMAQALKRFPGIGVITAQGKEVSTLDANGSPIAGQKEWKVEAHKSLPAVASAWVRMTRPHTGRLIGVRSLTVEVPEGGMDLGAEDHLLERVVFDVLGAGQAFGETQAVAATGGLNKAEAKHRLLAAVHAGYPDWDDEKAEAEARAIWADVIGDADPTGELLAVALERADGVNIAELAQ